MMKSNEEWMIDFQKGDKEGLAILYERLHEPLYAFLFRYTKEQQLSVDIVHDAFETLQKKKHDFDSAKGTVKAYLFQIAYRILLNRLNRRKRWRAILPFLVPTPIQSISPDEKMVVQQAIANLPEKQRAVILLAYYEDLPQEEIAQILSIPVGTVKSRLHNAIKSLKEALEEVYYHEGRISK